VHATTLRLFFRLADLNPYAARQTSHATVSIEGNIAAKIPSTNSGIIDRLRPHRAVRLQVNSITLNMSESWRASLSSHRFLERAPAKMDQAHKL